ncbi:uncharacterized protein EI90DRAFT_3134059 [Cantharellus anzutake]|uniref:uncharacterized protein n=1 Tax=Cantharellus anzutake TaxID=1750568 RepID=UPI0019034163|nr:uncharacterized protein EI90DRAFT_3134059 [Cantharellus anzutake]KAF8317007.1 hypothetical protein EI90DRAFT_3134059 [Cantharellus anzutake]
MLHSTLDKYNNAATSMIPPKPSLTWDDVTHPDFLSMVELLQGRDDIHSHEWAQEHFRAATQAWVKLQRAKEELLEETIEVVTASNPILASYISMTFKWHMKANSHLRKKLARLESHPSYLSPCGPGVSIHSVPGASDATQQSSSVEPDLLPTMETADKQPLGDKDSDDDGIAEEEDEEQLEFTMDKLVDLFHSIL